MSPDTPSRVVLDVSVVNEIFQETKSSPALDFWGRVFWEYKAWQQKNFGAESKPKK